MCTLLQHFKIGKENHNGRHMILVLMYVTGSSKASLSIPSYTDGPSLNRNMSDQQEDALPGGEPAPRCTSSTLGVLITISPRHPKA